MPRLEPFGTYELAERIGLGALGEVYRAFDRKDRRPVALKRLSYSASQDAEVVEALRGEAELGRALDHPSIAKVRDVGNVNGVHYIAYEYVHGRDLRALQERLSRAGERVPLDIAVHVALRVCEALGHAHGRRDAAGQPLGLIHRDVSPANIMIAVDGAVKLLDFGIARAEGRVLRTGPGEVKGTLGYLSPEQVTGGPLDARSDVYSLGVCLWELCAGRRLFEGLRPVELARQIVRGDVPPPSSVAPSVPEALSQIVLKALAHSVERRYASADLFHADLSALARFEGLLADPTRVARYVRSVFPEVAAEGAASRQEFLDMADNKGGSDLDVFEGLAKKSTRSPNSGLAPPPPSTQPRNKQTLVGGLAPLPPPPSAPPGAVSSQRPGSLPGVLPPPVAPPQKAMSGTQPGLGTAPPLPPVTPPPARSTPLPPPPSRLPGPPPHPVHHAPTATLPLPPSAQPGSSATSLPMPGPIPALPPPPTGALPPLMPPPGGKAAKPAGKAAADMDWDDDASTQVFDKQTHDIVQNTPHTPRPASSAAAPKVVAAAALLANSGGAAPPVKTLSTTTLMQPGAPVPSPAAAQPSARDAPTAIRPRPPVIAVPTSTPGSSRAGVILGGLSLAVVIALAVFVLMPKKGQVQVVVTAPGGGAVGKVEIFVDGQKKCDTTPCLVADLSPGPRVIKGIAPDYPPAEITVNVEGNKEKVVPLELKGAGASAAGALGGSATELKLAGVESQKNVKVSVDGVDKGVLPVDLRDLTPGTHKLKFDGGDRYEKLEQSVDLGAGQSKDLGGIKLKVVKGQVTFELATAGASVTLVRRDADNKKIEKKVGDLSKGPVAMDIDPGENWKVVATKKGYDDFVEELSFDDGQAEKKIKIELFEEGKAAEGAGAGKGAAPVAANPTPAPAPAPGPGPGPDATPKEPPKETGTASASGAATLNINSIPVSKVVLDGKPLGSTPKVGVSVPAGSHTVTFIHPDLGKQSVTVQVKAGETKTAAVKFKQ